MNKKYDFNWPKEYTPFEQKLDKVDDFIQDFIYNPLNRLYFDKRNRKIDVKIDKWDTWSMDDTLSHIIYPMLLQLQETKHGSPFVDDFDVPVNLRSTSCKPKENEWDTDDNHHKRWDYVLNEMIWTFQQIKDDIAPFYDLNDQPEVRQEQLDRLDNGLRLFGKYYLALWD